MLFKQGTTSCKLAPAGGDFDGSEIIEEIATHTMPGNLEVVSLKTFNTVKTGQEALTSFKESLMKSAKALNDAVLESQYKNADKILDIVVKKGKFDDLEKLEDIWDGIKSSYPEVKKVNISSL